MSIQDLVVSKAKRAIRSVKTLDSLHQLRAEEITNTNPKGGRKGVLEALEGRRLELLEGWRKSQAQLRKVPRALVGNLIDDFGNRIPKGQVLTGISKAKLDFFVKIGGVEFVESSN